MPWSRFASGGANWAQNTPSVTTVNTTTPTVIATVSFTSLGEGPVFAFGHGDGNPNTGTDWNDMAIYSDNVQVGPIITFQGAGASSNHAWGLVRGLGVLSAGAHTIEIRAWNGSGSMLYGERAAGPSLVVVELT